MESVINLSNRVLTLDEISILSRGLKFCPTPACPDPGQGKEDLDQLHRRLRLKSFFEELPKDDRETLSETEKRKLREDPNLNSQVAFKHTKFKRPSTWRGPIGPTHLEAYIASNERDYNNRPVYRPPMRQNTTKIEKQALRSISLDTSIVCKPADKGASIVVMNRLDYLREGYKQLSDSRFYRYMEEDLTQKHTKEVNDLVEDTYQNDEIDETVKDYLIERNIKTARFYMLPKIHKNIRPPPGRPVVAGIASPTEKISQFVDHFLNPCSIKIRSYVKDTNHFLDTLDSLGEVKAGTLLVTMDVTSLYTNIPNDEGIAAAMRALESNRPGRVKPTNLTIIKMLEIVLKKNNFQFNGNHYLQIGGTAIGTKAAPSFAVIYMGSFEEEHVYTYEKQPLTYMRYIDDIFMLWQHGKTELDLFMTHLNSRVETINFTSETSETDIAFLDVKVKIREGMIETDLYSKPTDSHDYLMYSSAHPQRCKDSIPYSQFLRIRRLCSNIKDYDHNVMNLALHFERRQYPAKLIIEAAVAARKLDRKLLISSTIKGKDKEDSDDTIFLITTFHPSDHTIREIAHKNWDILGKNDETNFLYKKKLMVGYRRPKNIRDILVHANIPRLPGDEAEDPMNTIVEARKAARIAEQQITPASSIRVQKKMTDFFTPGSSSQIAPGTSTSIVERPLGRMGTAPKNRGFSFCKNKSICHYCPRLNVSGKITSHTTGQEHECMKKISCRSSNLIYCINCNRCGIQYVGQTHLRLKDRFGGHYTDIKSCNLTKTVSRHLTTNGHNGIFDMTISILEFIKKPPKSQASLTIRNKVERRWIHLLRTMAPLGLNLED